MIAETTAPETATTAPYRVIDLSTGESHGDFESIEEAMGCVAYDRLTRFQVWNGDILLKQEEPWPTPGHISARELRGLLFGVANQEMTVRQLRELLYQVADQDHKVEIGAATLVELIGGETTYRYGHRVLA
jgi:hypothetical protein